MQLDFTVDVSGWERGLQGCGRRLDNLTPAHREIGRDILVPMVLEMFDTSGNGEWPSLAESTLIARAENPSGKDDISAAGGGAHKVFTKRGKVTKGAARVMAAAKPLIWSKKLYRSIRFEAEADYVDVGSPLKQSWRLFMGWTGAGPQTPERNPFKFRPGDAEKISRVFVRRIFGELVQ